MTGCLEASWLLSILQRSILSHPCVQLFFFFVSCCYRDFLLILPPICSYYECSQSPKRNKKRTSWKGRRTIFAGPPSIPPSAPSNGASKRRRVGAKCLLLLPLPTLYQLEREPAFTIHIRSILSCLGGGGVCCCCCYLTRCMIRDH